MPPVDAPLGPALGIAPVCGVDAVCRAYAVGAARPTTSAVAATTAAGRPRSRGADASARPVPTPNSRIAIRSAGSQVGVRSSRYQAHSAVPATVAPRTARTHAVPRRGQSSTAPMPTSAPTAGPSATV